MCKIITQWAHKVQYSLTNRHKYSYEEQGFHVVYLSGTNDIWNPRPFQYISKIIAMNVPHHLNDWTVDDDSSESSSAICLIGFKRPSLPGQLKHLIQLTEYPDFSCLVSYVVMFLQKSAKCLRYHLNRILLRALLLLNVCYDS